MHGVASGFSGMAAELRQDVYKRQLADRLDVFVEELDARGLGEESLAHREGEFLLQSVSVGPGGSELVLLGGLKQGLIAAAEFAFELAPYAVSYTHLDVYKRQVFVDPYNTALPSK